MYDPERYEKYKSAAARDAAQYTPRLVAEMDWGENEVILDYGCGAGSTGYNFILPTVEKTGSKLYSVDISDKMIEFAKREYSHPSITYQVGSILEDFPFKNQLFDKIYSIYVLHFVKDFRGALKKFHEVLKPGGTLGFTVVGTSRIFKALEDIGNRDKWRDIMKGYEQYVPEWVEKNLTVDQCFREALEQCGFQISKMELHTQTWKYASVDYLVEFYTSLNPYVRNLNESQLKELREDYADMIINQWKAVGSDGTPLEGKYELLYVIAKK